MPPKRKAAAAAAAKAAPAEAAPVAVQVDYSQMTVVQLKAECTKQGLDTTGKKADLVQRLSGGSSGPPAKMSKQSTIERAMDVMKASVEAEKKAKSKSKKKAFFKVDQYCPVGSGEVVEDYSCMLNQTNIGHNNNKYYVIQVVCAGASFYAFNRWGRVGEPGTQSNKYFTTKEAAVKDFEKKFHDKTKNKWEDRDKFKVVSGKYTMLDMGGGDDEEGEATTSQTIQKSTGPTEKCKLDDPTQSLIKLIFDNDMFKNALVQLDIDVKKMPLGKLSKAQIVKGFEALDEIKKTLDLPNANKMHKALEASTSKFYTVIPHDFGRARPPVINTQEALRKRLDMLITLGDIEMAQSMMKQQHDDSSDSKKKARHPLDEHYEMLKCGLDLVDKKSDEFKIIDTYVKNTNGYRQVAVDEVWRVDRSGEEDRMSPHKPIKHRKLLWHGTSVAVVVAILKSGLRIMPHSGGRVGRGIYFASENSKSAGYVGLNGKTGIMFLAEVALGKEHSVKTNQSHLTSAPSNFDSVVARGTNEPDPKHEAKLKFGSNDVIVPQGKPIKTEWKDSHFDQSEYLIYKESQCCIRYMLKMTFAH